MVILRSENSEISSFVELKKTGVWRFSSLSRRRPACVCRSVRIWALSLVRLCTFEEVAAQAEALVEDHWRNKAVLNEWKFWKRGWTYEDIEQRPIFSQDSEETFPATALWDHRPLQWRYHAGEFRGRSETRSSQAVNYDWASSPELACQTRRKFWRAGRGRRRREEERSGAIVLLRCSRLTRCRFLDNSRALFLWFESTCTVLTSAKHELRASVPSRHDLMREFATWRAKCFCQTEITEFHDSLDVNQQVVGLEITVEHEVRV